MNPKTDLRILKTKTAIHKAFVELLYEKELSKVSVTELANRANINRKTFYTYYSKVEDVLDEKVNTTLIILEQTISRYKFTSDSLDVEDLVVSLNNLLYLDADFYKRVIHLDQYSFLFTAGKNMLKKYLIRDYKNKSRDKKFIDSHCEFMAAGIFSVYFNWFIKDHDAKLIDLKDIAIDIIKIQLQTL